MLLLGLDSLSVSISTETLLDGVDALLVDGERVGLVGPNGSGKSTLLKILAQGGAGDGDSYCTITSGKLYGPLSADERPPGSVLLVGQDKLSWADLLPGAGSEEELRELSLSDALDFAMAEGVESALDDSSAWRRLSVAADKDLCWDLADYDNTPLGELSPGSALRAYLAVALQRQGVRLILLDEPTNHLDLPSIMWLQHTILESGKTVIMVSHDEAFLDAVADHVWEVDHDHKSLSVSGAQYSAYKHAKLLALEQQREAYDAQQKRHKHLSGVADKLRAASKAGENHQARDHDTMQRDFRRDRAGRSGKKAKAVEKLRDKEEAVDRVVEHVPLRIHLDPVGAGSDSSIIFDSVQLGYSGIREAQLPLPPLSFRIDYSERIAIIGYNGIGKSTLLRTLTEEIPPVAGTVSVGRQLRIGNLMQEHETLPRDVTPREHVAALTGLTMFTSGTRVIGYGLTRHQVDQPMRELNPGARARLLLATFALRSVNALVLDEPTNHLDEEAVAEVVATINRYAGTVIVVSHDRTFLKSLDLTATYSLTSRGFKEIESVDAFVEDIEEVVERVALSAM